MGWSILKLPTCNYLTRSSYVMCILFSLPENREQRTFLKQLGKEVLAIDRQVVSGAFYLLSISTTVLTFCTVPWSYRNTKFTSTVLAVHKDPGWMTQWWHHQWRLHVQLNRKRAWPIPFVGELSFAQIFVFRANSWCFQLHVEPDLDVFSSTNLRISTVHACFSESRRWPMMS